MQDDIEQAMIEYENVESINDINKNPATGILKDVIEQVPILGGVLKNALDQGLELYQKRKQDQLTQSIINNKDLIAPEEIHAVSFIIEYGKTREMLDRLANEKKVQMVCNLFVNYFLKESHADDVDVYEEYLSHIGQLSAREIYLLIHLNKFEKEFAHLDNLSSLERYEKSFDKLKQYAQEEWNISESELIGLMTGVCRSGFCKEEVGAFLGPYTGGIFYTTQYFEKFLEYIMDRKKETYEG